MKFKQPEHGTAIIEFGIKKDDFLWYIVGKDLENNYYIIKDYSLYYDYTDMKSELRLFKSKKQNNDYRYLNAGTKINYHNCFIREFNCTRNGWYWVREVLDV